MAGFQVPGALAAQPETRDSSGVGISRIEIVGVTALSAEEAESALLISVGEPIDRNKVVRSAENIRDLLLARGYEKVSVRSELSTGAESVLSFIVTENLPTRVSRIQIVTEGNAHPQWKRLETTLNSHLGISLGDILDRDRLASGVRELQSVLASEEFIGASINDIRIATAQKDSQYAVDHPQAIAGRWVEVEVRVDLGDRVTFGFRGNHRFSAAELNELIEQQRALGFGRSYIYAVKQRFEEAYHAIGFTNAKITPYVFERTSRQERHVTYHIEEGTTVRLGVLEFDGNLVFDSAKLTQIFFEEAPPLLKRRIYVEREIEKAAELVIQRLKTAGYLTAKLVTVNRRFNPAKDRVSIRLYLFEGDQTLVRSVRLRGSSAIAAARGLELLRVKEGLPLNLFSFGEGLEALKAAYRAKGYLEVVIAHEGSDRIVRYSDSNRTAEVDVEVVEGVQSRVSKITIEGLSATREFVVLRELPFHEGDVLAEPLIAEAQTRLRRLGVFSNVTLRVLEQPKEPSRKIVQVFVQEGTPGLVAGGIGYRNDLGARLFAQTAYTNIGGRNQTLSFNLVSNRRFVERRVPVEYQAQVGYVWPWFVAEGVTLRPTMSFERAQYAKFDVASLSLAGTIDKRLLRNPNLYAAFTYSLERTEQNAPDPLDDQTLTIGALSPSIRLDMRDNPLAPTRGFFGTLTYEWADPSFFSQAAPFPIGYTRFQMRTDYFVPISAGITGFFSFRTGIERNTQVSDDPRVAIPLVKQFTVGGAGSLRGFKEQELNLQDIAIRGTAAYVNYRAQLDLPIAGAMRFGPFVDAANLTVDRFSLTEEMRIGAGAGVHYQTPVGPVNFDLGFKIKPRPGESPYHFYFSIGII